MPELDHVFIAAPNPDAAAAALGRLGLTEGAPNAHPGQGTACRRFFFRNAYLELLYLTDEGEARSPLCRPTRLYERLTGHACPFGIATRPRRGEPADASHAHLDYRPPYLPAGLAIKLAAGAHLAAEPLIFHLPFAKRPDTPPVTQPLEHAAGVREITRVVLAGPWPESRSEALAAMVNSGLIELRNANEYTAELWFDRAQTPQTADARPELPLTLHW